MQLSSKDGFQFREFGQRFVWLYFTFIAVKKNFSNFFLCIKGGFDGAQRLDTVEFYEPRMDAWTTAPSMKYSRDGVSLASYGGYIHAIGGIDGPSYLNSVEYYDPNAESWQTAFSMKKSRAAAGVAVLNSDHFICLP